MTAQVFMLQGTQSDVGKSALSTALCRLLARRGVRVAPFKPQNLALNSAVTADGGEIGRAQAVQAQACGLEPHTDMNPILIKPNADRTSQIIVQGRAVATMGAGAYHQYKKQWRPAMLESFQRLTRQYDAVIVEGAGSPAEVNLRDHDLANMGFATLVNCPVLLIGRIDKGGVFAHLMGTLALLPPPERALVCGLALNKFRGNRERLEPGLEWLRQESGLPVMGVMPQVPGLRLAAEDNFVNPHPKPHAEQRVIAPRLPRLSNHTDFDPLIAHPQVDFRLIEEGQPIPAAELIVLPGSKSVRSDLAWLREHGWEQAIQRHLRYHGKVVGLCGGYQMLGRAIHDPDGLEGPAGSTLGLGLLELETTITPHKQLNQNHGTLAWNTTPVTGYEIHMGRTTGPDLARPALLLREGPHGARSTDDQLIGCYLHGLFDHPEALASLLSWSGLATPPLRAATRTQEQTIDLLADAFAANMDLTQLGRFLPGL